MQVLTITLNPAIDATYVVEGYRHGGANRVLRRHAMPGGKGNNVARILTLWGNDVTATGFLGGESGYRIETGLLDFDIEPRFTWIRTGESRTCHTILEADTGTATEILEPGPKVTGEDRDAFLRSLPELLAGRDVVVISGSAPPGASPAFLARLAKRVRTQRSGDDRGEPRPLALDASGPALEELLAARPDVLKPNEDEIRHLMGRSASPEEQVAWVQADLIPNRLLPTSKVILSRGRAGATLVTGSGVWQARPPDVPVVNTVGCGDALLAGFIQAWLAGAADAEALRHAVAAGTAAALTEIAGVVNPNHLARLKPHVEVTGGAAG